MSIPRPTAVTIHLVEHDPALREAFRCLLEDAHFPVIAHADASDLMRSIAGHGSAGCVLLDLPLSRDAAHETLLSLRDLRPDLPVIMLAGQHDISAAVAAIKAGAADFLVKPVLPEKLISAVVETLSASLTAQIDRAQEEELRLRVAALTPREREVADLVVAGYTSKEIGRLLEISPRTVEVHRAHVMGKLDTETVPDLVRLFALFG